jgi:hypothetical protein
MSTDKQRNGEDESKDGRGAVLCANVKREA